MFQHLLNVRYITSKNCFCSLSINNFKHLQSNSLVLHYNDSSTAYVSVDAAPSLTDDKIIGFNSLYAKALGIEDNSLVTVSEISKPPTIQSVTITAVGDNDHYVLESLALDVQSTLLQQIRVLNSGQNFVIWIGKSINVTVSVCDIKPVSPGSLDNLTEVVIKPPGDDPKQAINHKKIKENYNKEIASFNFFNEYKSKNSNLILRLVPFKELLNIIGEFLHPFSIFASKVSLPGKLSDTVTNPQIYLMNLLIDDASNTEEKLIYVRLYIFEDIACDFKLNPICAENIFVSDVLMDYFNCGVGSRVLLKPCRDSVPPIQEIEICSKRNFSIQIRETFQQYLADQCRLHKFVLNPNVVVDITDNFKCFLRFYPVQAKFCLVDSDFVRNCKLSVVTETLELKEFLEQKEFCMSKYTTTVGNYQEIVDKTVFLFVYNTKVYSKMYNVLITGKAGTGKTTLLKIIKNIVASYPYFIYTKKINCKSIKGKTVESLHKLFVATFFELVHRQPSVLILDDLHVLCEKTNESDALAQNAVYFNRVSEMLEGVFQSFCEHNAVGILASASSASKLNKIIYATRGNHLFKNVYDITPLSKNDRKELLEFFFSNYEVENVDLEKLSEKTESFVMQDMNDLANKTLFESYQEDHAQNIIKISMKHCEKALETVTLTCLDGANLHPPGDKDLDDIGGLSEVKKILVETLLWPSKYPNLFTNSPLRLPSGLLLYGPPGTGKTILAGAAARHCGLRLISIKGPELLSKYIGASEQAVRDVFQRAQSVKPCVLFFDEFDSLAPRRGHDNTGVTDRVVNQLLTQLDGIESLSGVFVLVATSRPDLLDPALLRPGRLDRHIRCPLPDERSRLEILKALSKSLKLASDVDLSELARGSSGFSGADLQAVLYSAQLDCVKDLLEDEANIEEFYTEIHQVQLMEALKSTRPSLTTAEQTKYEQIYRNFEGGGNTDFTPGSRATLA